MTAMPTATSAINWSSEPDHARDRARLEGKMALLEFSRAPRCAGSVRLVSEVYPQVKVARFISAHFAAARIPTLERPEVGEQFNVVWTPTLIVTEPDGTERHRIVGFLPAEDLLAQLDLALAKAEFGRGHFAQAERAFETIVCDHADTIAAPEADYWAGVSKYKHTRDREDLKTTGERLRDRYPGSEWAKKGSVWLTTAQTAAS